MAGSSPAMTKKRKVDDARRPTTANAIRAKIGEGLERILKPRKIFKKKPEEGNNAAPSVFRWLGALICPPAQARRCPASALPARGFFCACKFVICSSEELADIGWRSRLARGASELRPGCVGASARGAPPLTASTQPRVKLSGLGQIFRQDAEQSNAGRVSGIQRAFFAPQP
jgi:hypothetical protein